MLLGFLPPSCAVPIMGSQSVTVSRFQLFFTWATHLPVIHSSCLTLLWAPAASVRLLHALHVLLSCTTKMFCFGTCCTHIVCTSRCFGLGRGPSLCECERALDLSVQFSCLFHFLSPFKWVLHVSSFPIVFRDCRCVSFCRAQRKRCSCHAPVFLKEYPLRYHRVTVNTSALDILSLATSTRNILSFLTPQGTVLKLSCASLDFSKNVPTLDSRLLAGPRWLRKCSHISFSLMYWQRPAMERQP